MPAYAFKAIDARGLKHKGMMEADSTRQLRQHLRAQGWIPLSIEESGGRGLSLRSAAKGPRPAFNSKSLTAFTRELAILHEGGLPLEKALKLIAMQTGNLRTRERILAVHGQVVEGTSFAGSLASYPEDFPALYRATVTAGEYAGDLSGVLNKLADYGETHLRVMNKVKLALLYPAILTAFSVAVVAGLMIFVFPDITQTFIQSGHELPWLTRALIVLSDTLRHFGWLMVAGAAGAGVMLRRMLREPGTALDLHHKLLQIPLVSSLVVAMNMARFVNTLSMLRNSGVPLADALRIACDVLSNRWLRKSAEQATHSVIEGVSLNQALAQEKCFPPTLVSMIAGGEASGELDRVLTLAAHNQMKELENRILFGVAILEPVIILLLGLMVLLIVIAIMMPIMSMNQLVT